MASPFLAGTFIQSARGFHFSGDPPADVADRRNLLADDPWKAIASALANLREGRFDVTEHLAAVMQRSDDAAVWNACVLLLGYAAPYPVIRATMSTFDPRIDGSKPYADRYFCELLARSGGMWSVDRLISIHGVIPDREVKGIVEGYLAQLLEEDPGPVSAGPREEWVSDGAPPPFESFTQVYHDEEYLQLLKTTLAEVRSRERVEPEEAVFEGHRLDLRRVAERLLERLRRGEDSARVELGRMSLEATSGLDCSAFFDSAHRLRPLAAAAMVEEFLASGAADRYEAGARYFFGHRIPT